MQKYFSLALKIILTLISLLLIVTWARWFVTPDAMYAQYEVTANSRVGINMLKSDMGGYVLTLGLLTLLAVWRSRAWYPPAILGMAVILLTRILSVLQDGGGQMVWVGIGMELFALVSLVYLSRTQHGNDAIGLTSNDAGQ